MVQNCLEGTEVREEQLLGGYYRVDMYVPQHNLVIEVFGPYHLNGAHKLRKRDLTRRRIFKKLGYRYCEILTQELMGIRSDDARQEHVSSTVRTALMTGE